MRNCWGQLGDPRPTCRPLRSLVRRSFKSLPACQRTAWVWLFWSGFRRLGRCRLRRWRNPPCRGRSRCSGTAGPRPPSSAAQRSRRAGNENSAAPVEGRPAPGTSLSKGASVCGRRKIAPLAQGARLLLRSLGVGTRPRQVRRQAVAGFTRSGHQNSPKNTGQHTTTKWPLKAPAERGVTTCTSGGGIDGSRALGFNDR